MTSRGFAQGHQNNNNRNRNRNRNEAIRNKEHDDDDDDISNHSLSMKHSDQPNGNSQGSDPPPAYSPPGQDPPLQMQYTGNKQYGGASAPPPPPGIFAPGVSVPQFYSSSSTTSPSNAAAPHHTHQSATTTTTPTIVYANAATVNPNPDQFGPYPMRVICPICNAHIMTETHSTPGLLTYVLSGALCFLAGYLLCCLIPCCVRECKDIEHRCPSCQHKLGLFKRI